MISIHAPRAGSDPGMGTAGDFGIISIHAPRAGSDDHMRCNGTIPTNFNPRSPCGERRVNLPQPFTAAIQFQSTLPVRGATFSVDCSANTSGNFNPRSPCGERQSATALSLSTRGISIHAPRAGSDKSVCFGGSLYLSISIHAPRAGSDLMRRCQKYN